jgi:tRNA-2-methylthio-N6-dimethylallyladenosine synthase
MNKADSERIAAFMESHGLTPTHEAESADVIILNSCVVRQKAENRVLSKLGSLGELKKKRPDISVILTGCLVDGQVDRLTQQFPHIDFCYRPGRLSELKEWSESTGRLGRIKPGFIPSSCSPTAFVPVIEGCDNFCSYCIVPYRRGREKSHPLPEIVCEVQEMVRRGVREVTLVGQNVNSYGHDLPDHPDLADLLQELNKIEGLYRLRFITSHPKDMKPKLINMLPRLEKVCEHITLPIQSGNDEILKAMRRGYTSAGYRELVNQIRQTIPGVALSTDVIVGFPGETEEQFFETYALLKEIRFDTVHVAAYSPRPGTLASRTMEDNVPREIKMRRLRQVEELQEKVCGEINSAYAGKTTEILVEKKTGERWTGRTRTDKLVFFETPRCHRGDLVGKLVMIRIDRTSPWSMQGELVQETAYATA